MPPYLGEWWWREECRATTCFSLTQDLVTHLTVNLIPSLSILSPGRGVGVGGCRDQVQSPRCSTDEDDRVFTPLQLWIYADEEVGVGCNGIYWRDPCYCSHTAFCPVLHLLSFSTFPTASFLPLSNFLTDLFSSFALLYNLLIEKEIILSCTLFCSIYFIS